MFDGIIHDDAFNILNDIIDHKDRIFLVPESSLKKKILEDSHDASLDGHVRFVKTYMNVRERLSWKDLNKEVMEYVRECFSYNKKKENIHI